MMLKDVFSSLRPALLGAGATLALIAAGSGACSPPPDTSPAVTITMPTMGQVLPAGKPIDVRFTISGFDASGSSMVPFMLVGSDMKVPGQGQVRAFLSTGNFIARAVSVPNDANPFLIPDPMYGSAASLVTPGPKKITLHLYYNDSSSMSGGTDVDPQREGVVSVMIQ